MSFITKFAVAKYVGGGNLLREAPTFGLVILIYFHTSCRFRTQTLKSLLTSCYYYCSHFVV